MNEMEQAYGQHILKNLSVRLMDCYDKDWSYGTLVRCRKFYISYYHAEIVATPLPQLENVMGCTNIPKDANIYAQQYAICLPDKTILQQKLREWISEFKDRKEVLK